MRVLVIEGKYYEIPEYIKNDMQALDYIDTIKRITDEEMERMVDGPPTTTTTPPTPSPTDHQKAGGEGKNND